MPSRNVYVSETDVALFDHAAQLAGGLSPAIAAALRLYVVDRESTMAKTTNSIELEVADGPITRRKRFNGTQLLSLTQSHGLRRVTYRVYRTERGQYAVYTTDEPDWAKMGDADDSAWEDPRTWSETFYETKDKSLQVFPTVEDLTESLPDDVSEAVREVLTGPPVTDLDI